MPGKNKGSWQPRLNCPINHHTLSNLLFGFPGHYTASLCNQSFEVFLIFIFFMIPHIMLLLYFQCKRKKQTCAQSATAKSAVAQHATQAGGLIPAQPNVKEFKHQPLAVCQTRPLTWEAWWSAAETTTLSVNSAVVCLWSGCDGWCQILSGSDTTASHHSSACELRPLQGMPRKHCPRKPAKTKTQ